MGELAAEYSTTAVEFPGTTYLTVDHLGSVRTVVDSSGVAKRRYDYRPFGQMIQQGVNGRSAPYPAAESPGPGDGWTVKFTGKERDAESGLDYFGARYFAGAQGRFTSPDEPLIDQQPDGPQSWNLYSYVRNNPRGAEDKAAE